MMNLKAVFAKRCARLAPLALLILSTQAACSLGGSHAGLYTGSSTTTGTTNGEPISQNESNAQIYVLDGQESDVVVFLPDLLQCPIPATLDGDKLSSKSTRCVVTRGQDSVQGSLKVKGELADGAMEVTVDANLITQSGGDTEQMIATARYDLKRR